MEINLDMAVEYIQVRLLRSCWCITCNHCNCDRDVCFCPWSSDRNVCICRQSQRVPVSSESGVVDVTVMCRLMSLWRWHPARFACSRILVWLGTPRPARSRRIVPRLNPTVGGIVLVLLSPQRLVCTTQGKSTLWHGLFGRTGYRWIFLSDYCRVCVLLGNNDEEIGLSLTLYSIFSKWSKIWRVDDTGNIVQIFISPNFVPGRKEKLEINYAWGLLAGRLTSCLQAKGNAVDVRCVSTLAAHHYQRFLPNDFALPSANAHFSPIEVLFWASSVSKSQQLKLYRCINRWRITTSLARFFTSWWDNILASKIVSAEQGSFEHY